LRKTDIEFRKTNLDENIFFFVITKVINKVCEEGNIIVDASCFEHFVKFSEAFFVVKASFEKSCDGDCAHFDEE